MKCLYCHEVIDPLGKFCPKCGLPLSEEITLQSGGFSGGAAPWLSGAKPLIALVVASACGAFIGVSAGWMGARMGSSPGVQTQTSRVTQPTAAPPVAVTAPVALAAPAAVTSPATGAPDLQTPGVSSHSSDSLLASATPAESAPDSDKDPTVETETAPPPTHQFDGVWAGAKPKKRVQKPTYVPPPDPLPPSHVLAMNPNRHHDPQYVMMYWLGPTADLYGGTGPGPAERVSQDPSYFDRQ